MFPSARVRYGSIRRLLAVLIVVVVLPLAASTAHAAGTQGQFVVRCRYSHTLADDPIMMPGQSGASHSHDFFGNVTTDANSTAESMLAGGTTCRVPSDTAGYWTPTAYLNGIPIQPKLMRVYYLGTQGATTQTIPAGLQLIGGNRDAASPAENPHVSWYCGANGGVKTPLRDTPYDCTSWAEKYGFVDGVVGVVDLPSCWDGEGSGPESLDYPFSGVCAAPYRIRLPRVSERVHLGIMNPTNPDGSIALTLASGPYWTLHADFWNTWQQPRLDELVQDCLVAQVHCGSVGVADQIAWTQEFGTTRYDLAYGVATDGSAAYVGGFTNEALGGQVYHRHLDAFVRKYDAEGNVLWTRQFGSAGTDQVLAIAADDGGVTVAGSTDGRLPQQVAAGGVDAFVARFGPNGSPLWVTQFGTAGDDRATGVVTSDTGAFVLGTTGGALGSPHGGGSDAFLTRVDAAGKLAWVRQFGTRGADETGGLALRSSVLYATGWTTMPSADPTLPGDTDGFVRAFGTSGSLRWRRQIGTSGIDKVTSVSARENGIFIAGSTGGTFAGQMSSGGIDAFVAKLTRDGRDAWLHQFGSSSDDEAVAVGTDPNAVYAAGSTAGALPENELLGEWDGFLAKYHPNGAPIWARQFGTIDYDRVYGLAVEPTGLYLVGTTHGAVEGQLNAGDRDVFVTRVAFS